MAKKKKAEPAPEPSPEREAEPEEKPAAPPSLAGRIELLEQEHRDLAQDISDLAALIGGAFGEPLKSRAIQIATRHGRH